MKNVLIDVSFFNPQDGNPGLLRVKAYVSPSISCPNTFVHDTELNEPVHGIDLARLTAKCTAKLLKYVSEDIAANLGSLPADDDAAWSWEGCANIPKSFDI